MTVHHNASLLDCPVTEFLDRLAAKQPAPGGNLDSDLAERAAQAADTAARAVAAISGS